MRDLSERDANHYLQFSFTAHQPKAGKNWKEPARGRKTTAQVRRGYLRLQVLIGVLLGAAASLPAVAHFIH